MIIILSLLIGGALVGYVLRNHGFWGKLDESISYTIYAMLFIFGITIGANKSLLSNIDEYGAQAAFIAFLGVLGSVCGAYLVLRFFGKEKRHEK